MNKGQRLAKWGKCLALIILLVSHPSSVIGLCPIVDQATYEKANQILASPPPSLHEISKICPGVYLQNLHGKPWLNVHLKLTFDQSDFQLLICHRMWQIMELHCSHLSSQVSQNLIYQTVWLEFLQNVAEFHSHGSPCPSFWIRGNHNV